MTEAPNSLSIQALLPELEQAGLITRTFRRLDPDRQRAILDAILEEAAERGPTSVSIKGIARRAGVSVGALYTYFGSRDGLLAFAVQVCVRSMTQLVEAAGPELAAMPVRQALTAYVTGGLEWSRTTAALVAYFARGAYQGDPAVVDEVVRPVAEAMRATIGSILAAARARGELRPGLDLEATSRVVHALTVVVCDAQLLPYLNVYVQVVGDDVAPQRALAAAVDLIMSGIGAPTDEGR